MSNRFGLLWRTLVLAAVSLVSGCGGGGSDSGGETGGAGGTGSSSGETLPSITAPAHAQATMALTAAAAPELAAQSVAAFTLLRSAGYLLAIDLGELSPAKPTNRMNCGDGGSWSYRYIDTDNSGTRSAGDRIIMEAPGCSVAVFGNGGFTATVLAANSTGLVDVRIVIEGGTLPYMQGWNWMPTLRGTLRLTADANDDVWLRSEGELVFTASAVKSFRVSNLGLRLRDDLTNNPPAPGAIGSLDLAFDTLLGAGRRIAIDTVGLVAGFSANVAPEPGYIVLHGAGNSAVRIVNAKPDNSGWYRLATDADGDGVEEAIETISFFNFFNAL